MAPPGKAPRTIAIGDIHGCAEALRVLIEQIDLQRADTLVILGDCVDRGPDTRGVIEQLLTLRERCKLICLFGNHEEMMLNFLDGKPQPDDWLDCGGREALKSYGAPREVKNVPQSHIDFIRSWIDYWENDTHFFVHGGYEPDHPLGQQHWGVLRWQSLRDGILPPHQSGKTAVVGHTSQKDGEVFDLEYLKCIDTFCCGGGWLTALDTGSDRLWQVDKNGRLRE